MITNLLKTSKLLFPICLRGVLCLSITLLVISCKKDEDKQEQNQNVFTDSRDGQVYPWVVLNDGKKWMAGNINFETADSWCYDNDESNCEEYGRLYTWASAKTVCPTGWHLPTNEEWELMVKEYGGHSDDSDDSGQAAYAALIDGGSTGLNCLRGGYRHNDGSFLDLNGVYGYYWSSTEYDSNAARSFAFFNQGNRLLQTTSQKGEGFSCRCVED